MNLIPAVLRHLKDDRKSENCLKIVLRSSVNLGPEIQEFTNYVNVECMADIQLSCEYYCKRCYRDLSVVVKLLLLSGMI